MTTVTAQALQNCGKNHGKREALRDLGKQTQGVLTYSYQCTLIIKAKIIRRYVNYPNTSKYGQQQQNCRRTTKLLRATNCRGFRWQWNSNNLSSGTATIIDIGLLYERRRAEFERKIGARMDTVLQSFSCGCVFSAFQTFLLVTCVCCDFKVFFYKCYQFLLCCVLSCDEIKMCVKISYPSLTEQCHRLCRYIVSGDVGINASRIVLTVDTAEPDIHQRLCLGNVYQVRAYTFLRSLYVEICRPYVIVYMYNSLFGIGAKLSCIILHITWLAVRYFQVFWHFFC